MAGMVGILGRGPDEMEQFLADAVDIARQRDAAVHHDGKPKFLGRI
jgi:hypothetical protein